MNNLLIGWPPNKAIRPHKKHVNGVVAILYHQILKWGPTLADYASSGHKMKVLSPYGGCHWEGVGINMNNPFTRLSDWIWCVHRILTDGWRWVYDECP